MTHLLLLEDDASLAETLKDRLEDSGYTVAWVSLVAEARRLLNGKKFDLMIFDVGLPDGNGFDLARELRAQNSNLNRLTPFVFLTAMNTAEFRLEGYELGAEEFIPKPFHLKELLLRVKHVLENHAEPSILRVGKREVHWESLEVRENGLVIERLQPRDATLLRLLVLKSPSVVSRDEIIDRIWGEEKFPSTRTVDNAVVRLRQAIGDATQEWIRTVRSIGYQWNSPRETE